MRFNNTITVVMLGAAQVAFLFGATLTVRIISGMVALAAVVALCGFCFGCFLNLRFNMQRFRLFGTRNSSVVKAIQNSLYAQPSLSPASRTIVEPE